MAQIQIPGIVRAGQHTQQGLEGLQNALLTGSRLQTMGLENQALSQSMAKRAELEALLRTSPNPERDGYEWAKRNDPNLADKLSTSYIQRFAAKARLDPKNAAMELENATGEKIELGNRYSKLPIEGGEAYVDNFSGHVFQPSNAKEMAQIRADFAAQLKERDIQGRKEIEELKATLRPEKQDMTATVYEDFRSDDPAKRQRAAEYLKQSRQGGVQMGMPQFVGTQGGEAIVFQPQRGGTGSMATVPLPGQGPMQPRTEPADIRTQRMAFGKAEPVLASISELSERINVNKGVLAKVVGGVERAKAQANLNDDVAEYESLISGFTPMVARAVGHVGVLTEQDVQSVRKMFPAPGDSKSLRDRKIARLKTIIAGVQQQIQGAGGGATSAAPTQGTPKILSIQRVD